MGKRSGPPAPLSSSSSRRQNSFGSESSEKSTPRSSTTGYFDDYRQSSFGHSSKPSSPTVNLHTYCGRHTDQFLFGGKSLTNIVRSPFRKE
ncbi:hypothetical protein F4778DRAFT_146021 [Xylariomycetidae sp. FL2044]|nr:hypothetical protein F4778DRAFT_146021 [Xylariomycetidae sp. FL2044]